MQDDKKLIIPDYSLTSGSDVQVKNGNKNDSSQFKILFVDDEEPVLSSLKDLLEGKEFECYYYSLPKDALRFLRSTKVDLIVSDMKMPEIPGKDFLILASDISPESIKIIVSSYEEKPVVLDMLANGIAHYYFMKPWDNDDLLAVLDKFSNINLTLEQSKIKQYLKSFSKLPAPKTISLRLNKVLNSEDVNINLIVNELEYHPFLIAKVLQIANSVSFGVRKEIYSLREAIILIGLQQLRTLVISFELLKKFFDSLGSRYQNMINDFWNQSLNKANIARRIAENWNEKVDRDLIFISTLLSNIGVIAWLYTEPDTFNTFINKLRNNQITTYEAERTMFIFEHDKIGSILLQLWNFPKKIIDIVENHHSTKLNDPYIQIIQLADQLSNPEPDSPHNPIIEPLLDEFKEKLNL
ncbi:MAG: HDOD domain-containing protein [Ignavibacteriaceae bacterium]